jgi:hypothetical protein
MQTLATSCSRASRHPFSSRALDPDALGGHHLHARPDLRADGFHQQVPHPRHAAAHHHEVRVEGRDQVRDADPQEPARPRDGLLDVRVPFPRRPRHRLAGHPRGLAARDLVEPGRQPAGEEADALGGEGGPARERLQAAATAAPAGRAVGEDREVPQFPRRPERPQAQPPVDRDPPADARPQREEDHRPGLAAQPEDQFSEGRRPHVVEEEDLAFQGGAEEGGHGHVAPLGGKVGEELRHAPREVDQAGDAHPQRRGRLSGLADERLDALGDPADHRLRTFLSPRGELAGGRDLPPGRPERHRDVRPAEVHSREKVRHARPPGEERNVPTAGPVLRIPPSRFWNA